MSRLPLIVGAALTSVMLVLHATGALRTIEHDSVDARFGIRGTQSTKGAPVLVAIDDRSLQALDLRWPLPRRFHARAIDRLRASGARVIAYDVQFTAPTPDDAALEAAIARARGRVVLATTRFGPRGSTDVLGGDAVLRRIGARASFAGVPEDGDGTVRRFPFGDGGLKSFAVVTSEVATGHPASTAGFHSGSAWIDYRGGPGTMRAISFADVLDGRFDPAAVRGRIVVVGVTAPGLGDQHRAPVGGNRPIAGVELQAEAIDTMRRGVPLRPAPGWLAVAAIVVLGMAAPVSALRFRPLGALAVAALSVAVYALATQLAFDGGTILALVVPGLAGLGGLVGTIAAIETTTARDRSRTRELFARFVPGAVIDEILDAGAQDPRAGARRVQATAVFVDLRGFTAFSEEHAAGRVTEVLNRYLTAMGDAIAAHGGTLVSAYGDGILSVFGAPAELPDHADRALAAVREMAGPRLRALNSWMRETGAEEDLEIGVGVNSGVFTAGVVGSRDRLIYTVVGDAVNIASRLEAMTKEIDGTVLISDTTRALLRTDAPDLRYVDAREVRGKKVKANLWTLADHAGAALTADRTARPS